MTTTPRSRPSPHRGSLPAVTLGVAALIAAFGLAGRSSAEATLHAPLPVPTVDEAVSAAPALETAVLAGGCFWGVQGVFQHVAGVASVVSGYAGGDAATATYPVVSTGTTGHAEAVRITYDPHKVSYGRLLQIYFSVAHDPTELNRQGPDSGTQYRSTVFAGNADQSRIAKAYIAQVDAAKAFSRPLATTVEVQRAFYPAEAHHQDFLTLHPTYPYIAVNDLPKVDNLKRLFPQVYQPTPVLVGAAGDGMLAP